MTWYTIYEAATGKRVSVGTVLDPRDEGAPGDVELAKRGLAKMASAFDPRVGTKRWNEGRQDYDDVAVPKGTIPTGDFLTRFTAPERERLFESAKNDPSEAVRKRVQAFVEFIKAAGQVDLDDGYVVTSVNQMETAGLIGAGRAAEVLG